MSGLDRVGPRRMWCQVDQAARLIDPAPNAAAGGQFAVRTANEKSPRCTWPSSPAERQLTV